MTHGLKSLIVLLAITFVASAFAEKFKYSELQIKDYEEMQNELKIRIKKAQTIIRKTDDESESPGPADQEAVEQLREALLLVLSRPNQDNMLGKLLPEVRRELTNVNSFEDSLDSVVSEAIDAFLNPKLAVVYKSTYLFVLENFLSEFQPEFKDRENLRKTLIKVRDAKLEIPDSVKKDLKLRSMLKVESPSARAQKILDGLATTKAEKPVKSP